MLLAHRPYVGLIIIFYFKCKIQNIKRDFKCLELGYRVRSNNTF